MQYKYVLGIKKHKRKHVNTLLDIGTRERMHDKSYFQKQLMTRILPSDVNSNCFQVDTDAALWPLIQSVRKD